MKAKLQDQILDPINQLGLTSKTAKGAFGVQGKFVTRSKDLEIPELEEALNVVVMDDYKSGRILPEPKLPVVYDSYAYSMSEGGGFWQVVEIQYNTRTMETSEAKIVEKNTEKSIINERLVILLLGRDYI